MLPPLFWAEMPPCVAKTWGFCWGSVGVSLLGLHCRELLPSAGCTGQTPNPLWLLSPACHRGSCRDLSLVVMLCHMLVWIGESSRKLFLHREGAAAGHWPQAISPGLHRGLISSFASLGMGLGGCSKRRLSRFQSKTQ